MSIAIDDIVNNNYSKKLISKDSIYLSSDQTYIQYPQALVPSQTPKLYNSPLSS